MKWMHNQKHNHRSIHVESICNRMFIVCLWTNTVCISICICACTCTAMLHPNPSDRQICESQQTSNSNKRNQNWPKVNDHTLYVTKKTTHILIFYTSDWLCNCNGSFFLKYSIFIRNDFFATFDFVAIQLIFFASLDTQTPHAKTFLMHSKITTKIHKRWKWLEIWKAKVLLVFFLNSWMNEHGHAAGHLK